MENTLRHIQIYLHIFTVKINLKTTISHSNLNKYNLLLRQEAFILQKLHLTHLQHESYIVYLDHLMNCKQYTTDVRMHESHVFIIRRALLVFIAEGIRSKHLVLQIFSCVKWVEDSGCKNCAELSAVIFLRRLFL